MFSMTKTYTDYNDIEKTETFWFNLSKAELSKFALGPSGGIENTVAEIVSTNDTGRIMEIVEDLICLSYGKKMPDGRFAKVDENGHRYADSFKQTVAYDNLFMDLLLDGRQLIAFVNGIMPSDLKEAAAQASADAMKKMSELEARGVTKAE